MILLIRSLCLVLLSGLAAQAAASSPVSPEEARVALAKTEAALAEIPVRSDVVFMFAQGNRLSGRKFEPHLIPEIEKNRDRHPLLQLEYELWRIRDQALPRVPRMALSPEAYDSAAASQVSELQVAERVMRMMSVALSCRQRVAVGDIAGTPGLGYVSTHQLLSLMLATSRGCLPRGEFERGSVPYVRRVYSELLRNLNEASDIQVERAAFLVLAGRADLIPQKYLRELLARQSPDGLWYFGTPPDHTSALAYLALSSVFLPHEPQKERKKGDSSGAPRSR